MRVSVTEYTFNVASKCIISNLVTITMREISSITVDLSTCHKFATKTVVHDTTWYNEIFHAVCD